MRKRALLMALTAVSTAVLGTALPGGADEKPKPVGVVPLRNDAGAVVGVRIPGKMAYVYPDRGALDVESDAGVPPWSDPKLSLVWFGELRASGAVQPTLRVGLNAHEHVRYRLTITPGGAENPDKKAERSVEVEAVGGNQGDFVEVRFPEIPVAKPGYVRLTLQGIKKSGQTFGSVDSLTLNGPALADAHFPWSRFRSAASVHLGYPLPEGIGPVDAFYTEVTAKADPITTYYCAAGWQRGYFGYQVNGPKERRVIFSVWDAGGEPIDPNKVKAEDRVQLLAKGKDVYADRFGNEGTGGHSHLVYPWKTGDTYRFLVTVAPDGPGHAIYAGYFFFPERHAWGLIARFRAPVLPRVAAGSVAAATPPKPDVYLRGLYAFDEDFSGNDGDRRRLAEFGRQWVHTAGGGWRELTQARFTHTDRETMSRTDFDAGPTKGGSGFFLASGGYVSPHKPIAYGDILTRESTGSVPADLDALLASPPSGEQAKE